MVLTTQLLTLKKWISTLPTKFIIPKTNEKKYKTLTTILKSFGTNVIFATNFSFITMSFTGIGLTVILISTSRACGISIGNNVMYEIVMQKYIKYRKQYKKDQQTIKPFENIYRKRLHDNRIDKSKY